MRFTFHPVPGNPGASWCAILEKDHCEIALFHGNDVEIRADAFVEGAWSGDFGKFDFLEAGVMCGTGGRINGNEARFGGGTDRLSPLFSLDAGRTLCISNSPIFVMTASGDEPDPAYPYYPYDIVRIWRQGLFCLDGGIPLRSGRRLGVHFGAILHVGRGGALDFRPHDPGFEPGDYAEYRSILHNRVNALLANARDAGRTRPLRPLVAMSRGYDSTAAAVLVRDGGCREAVTLVKSGAVDRGVDSGLANAIRLEMRCREVEASNLATLGATAAAELSMFGIACETPVAAFERDLEGGVLVSGHFGDTIWSPVRSAMCHYLSQSWARFACGINGVEFRLRVGYLHFAPATILARHHRALHAITHDPTMRPWWVDGSYNRPIARRIIEEAGLPRGTFALVKRAGGHENFRLRNGDTSPALESYRAYLQANQARVCAFRRWGWRARVTTDRFLWRFGGVRARQFVPSSPRQRRFPFLLNSPPILLGWPAMFTFQWVHALLASRYRIPKSAGK